MIDARTEIERILGVFDPADPTHSTSDPQSFWTTTNVAEAIPGVLTPLNWSIWSRVTERASREAAYRIGAFKRSERRSPELERDRFIRAFRGRAALDVGFMALLGDRMPGTTGPETVASVFGRVPDGLVFEPTKRRYPVIAFRLPPAFLGVPRRLRSLAAGNEAWWRDSVTRADGLGHEEAIRLFADAIDRFNEAMLAQVVGIVSVMQPVYNALRQTVEDAGAGDLSTLSGASGGAEMAVIADMWHASRGRIDVSEVTRRHGFHGPLEGEIESRVWREEDEPLRSMIARYAERDESEDPAVADAERRRARGAAERELLDAVPPLRRPGVRLLLRFARERLPMRGVGKRAFLQALDVARSSSRRLGEELASAGVLQDSDDAVYMTATELVDPPPGARELVAERRERRLEFQATEIPFDWQGMPEPLAAAPDAAGDGAGEAGRALLTGIGVSGATVEGHARVLTSPDFAEVESGEVLVARTTDPSWSSVMFISSALVMDIGGALSHAAVVARELEIPCVVNTQSATRVLRTGDRIRVDGKAGTVEVLEPAP